MANVNDMFPSRWLKASDCEDEDLIATIHEIKTEMIGIGKDASEKWIVFFSESDKGLILNKTNMNTLAKLYGDDTDGWIGKKIAMFATEVQYQSDMVKAIRIRSKAPARGKPARPSGEPAAIASTSDDDSKIPF